MKMPVLFVGHGSPMNAIEHNPWTENWRALGEKIKPKAIVMVSAHWYTRGTYTQDVEQPPVINDMYGFPKELYEINYQVNGDLDLSNRITQVLGDAITINNEWGLDHGAWSVLVHMYPNKDIPIVQVSIDAYKSPEEHFEIGRKLSVLRDEGYLIMGSGNIVHNLRRVDFHKPDGFDWADEFDLKIKQAILDKNFETCINHRMMGEISKLAVPTTDHYDPLLYCLGAVRESDEVSVFNDDRCLGSLSMTGYLFE